MSDDVPITPGSGKIIAAKEISSRMHQLVLLANSSGSDAAFGSGAAGATVLRTVSATDSPGVSQLDTIKSSVQTPGYETVAASQTAQILGSTGAIGDRVSHLVIIPATTSPGNVLLLDNATSITVFAGGASSVPSLIPFSVPLSMYSTSGAWKVTTGANVSVIAVGSFT